jgi:hypothetical protein
MPSPPFITPVNGPRCATGKQSAYLEFHFGDRVNATDVLKSVGKFATWETPVQLTGAGITMKARATECDDHMTVRS